MKDKRLYARHAKVKRGAQLHKMQWKRRGGEPVLGKQTAIPCVVYRSFRRISQGSCQLSNHQLSMTNDQPKSSCYPCPVSVGQQAREMTTHHSLPTNQARSSGK